MYEQYDHHGIRVWVRSDLKGKHRSFCLCHSCGNFNSGQADNCPIANDTFQNCVKHGLTTPVFECPKFKVISNTVHGGKVYRLEEVKSNDGLKSGLAGTRVMIRSREHDAFWRSEGHGYTPDAWEAGVYDFVEAFNCTSHCGPEKGIEFVVC